jgi:hypothetical protein
MYVIRIIFNRAYLRKIESTLLYLYGFERAGDKSDKERSEEENREVKNLAVL